MAKTKKKDDTVWTTLDVGDVVDLESASMDDVVTVSNQMLNEYVDAQEQFDGTLDRVDPFLGCILQHAVDILKRIPQSQGSVRSVKERVEGGDRPFVGQFQRGVKVNSLRLQLSQPGHQFRECAYRLA